MAERLPPAFPRVERALCGVNEAFLNAETELRRRMLTSGRLAAAVRAAEPGGGEPWRAALDGLPHDQRARRLPAPELADDAFYDADHLAPAGARRLAATIAGALGR